MNQLFPIVRRKRRPLVVTEVPPAVVLPASVPTAPEVLAPELPKIPDAKPVVQDESD